MTPQEKDHQTITPSQPTQQRQRKMKRRAIKVASLNMKRGESVLMRNKWYEIN